MTRRQHRHRWKKQPMEDWQCSEAVDGKWCGGTVAYVCQHPDCTDCRCAAHAPKRKRAKPFAHSFKVVRP